MVTGTPIENQTLTADTSTIADIDGLSAFSYQWLRDGNAITGATGSSYSLGDADVGKSISVRVTYTDQRGTVEQLTSAGTSAITNVNDTPTGLPTLSGTASEDQTLTVDISGIADNDGLGTFTYQWLRGGSMISGATDDDYTLGDADVGAAISVRVSYTDGQGTVETLTSLASSAIVNVNDAPSGQPAISGTPREGNTLSAGASLLSDADGLGAVSYQWYRDGIAISGATGGTYVVTGGDVGATLTVGASYTDGHGTSELVLSAGVTGLPKEISASMGPNQDQTDTSTSTKDNASEKQETIATDLSRPQVEDRTGIESAPRQERSEEADNAPEPTALMDVPIWLSQEQNQIASADEPVDFDALDFSALASSLGASAVPFDEALETSEKNGQLMLPIFMANASDTTSQEETNEERLPGEIVMDPRTMTTGLASSAIAVAAAWTLRAAATAGSLVGYIPMFRGLDIMPIALRRRSLMPDATPLSQADQIFERKEQHD